MLNSELSLEECDATVDDSSNGASLIKIILNNFDFRNLKRHPEESGRHPNDCLPYKKSLMLLPNEIFT